MMIICTQNEMAIVIFRTLVEEMLMLCRGVFCVVSLEMGSEFLTHQAQTEWVLIRFVH